MKPNWKDYLKATGVFVFALLASISIVLLILLGIVLIATYQAVAIGLGLAALLGFAVWFVGGSIHLLAVTNARDRLDKDDEM